MPKLKRNKNDKEYQRKIIDHLVHQVFVKDDHTVVYFNIKAGKSIENVSLEDTNSAILGIKSVQTQSPLPCQTLQITTSCGLKRFLFKLQRKQFPFIPADFGVVCRPPKFSLRLCAGIRSYRPFFFYFISIR